MHHFISFKTIEYDYKSWVKEMPHLILIHVCISHIQLFAIPWTVALQALLSIGFPRQEYWSTLPFPTPGDLPDLGIKSSYLVSSALWVDSLPLHHLGSP